MQIKLFTDLKSKEIALNKANLTKSKKTSKTRQIWLRNGTKNNNTSFHMFLDQCYAFGLLL